MTRSKQLETIKLERMLMEQKDIRINKFTAGIAVTILIAVMGHVGVSLIWAGRITERIDAFQRELKEAKESMVSGTQYRYTSIDAGRDKEMSTEMFRMLSERVNAISGRVGKLEELHIKP